MGKGSGKRVPAGRIQTGPPRKAVPAGAASPARGFVAVDQTLFRVRWNRFDYQGPWCIGASTPDALVTLMMRLRDMEGMTPARVFSGDLGKDYGEPARLPNRDARKRLEELGLADETCVSRLRIGGAGRLYGFRRDPEFYAVFWDPKHEIWPSSS
ncbi:hypothetical protein [Plantactinospora endophytica]|uniref:Uncharacterized protein n=1 Tax=Plantactinospora endophytica TaxID=673535 RepID=A0ABQ4EEN0_9ACTN|nr:hypothetical protein [Plantactinospora endophytica]GIG93149.1 hypothetical protein Pen02_80850 [Plantactinospora endophytica]